MTDIDAAATVELAHDVRGAGAPIVLLPGTGYAGSTWPASLIEGLAADHLVITPDYRGTGRTPGTDGAYATRLFAADVSALLRRLDAGPAHVLGHSMGGRVAQWVALDAPELVRSLVLAASGPGGPAPSAGQAVGIPLEAALTLIEQGYEGYMRRQITSTFFTPEFVARDPATVDGLVAAYWNHRPSLRDYLKHVVARQAHSTRDRLAEIRQPALVLVGDADTHAGGTGSHLEQSEYLAAHLPNARLHVIPGARHGYFWECPDESLAAVRAFLQER
jgi:pimeloyl-ACP methyl ester carboxylesterase